jgi:hypothetical protein
MIYSREVNHLIERGIKFEATKTGKFKIISFFCFFSLFRSLCAPLTVVRGATKARDHG